MKGASKLRIRLQQLHDDSPLPPSPPRVDHLRPAGREIRRIARDDDQVVLHGAGQNERVHHADGLPRRFQARHQRPPQVHGRRVDRNNAPREARRQPVVHPHRQLRFAARVRQALDASLHFADRDRADEQLLLIHRIEPGNHPRVGLAAGEFRKDAGIQ